MNRRLASALSLAVVIAAGAPAHAKGGAKLAKLATIAIPGDKAFVKTARDVIDVVFALDPSLASNDGLFDDAVRVPSYTPAAIKKLVKRLDKDLAALKAMPWHDWAIDQQIDFRWIYASAETARRQLVDEQLFVHRPATWLEPLANDLIAFGAYAPDDHARPGKLWAQVPAMVKEVGRLSTQVTARDRETARKLIAALVGMATADGSPRAKAAIKALNTYDAALAKLTPTKEFTVVGADDYAWRLQHSLLLPMTPAQLLAQAQAELDRVDGEVAKLQKKIKPSDVEPTKDQEARATALTRDGMLALYDGIEVALRQATIDGKFVSIPDGVGPIHARETPDAMVPLTGDGGSMNPPPPYIDSNIGYWNVEHFHAEWTQAERLDEIGGADFWQTNGMGPYAAHEGFPGHHLQLAIARLHPDPIRSILPDGVENEGWGLYAEEELWSHGGFGASPEAHVAVLRSYRHRIARVFYDVNIETGAWDLQQGADFQQQAAAGKGAINEDILRAIQWPTQLVWYFTGKQQIVALKADYKKKLGAAYTDTKFHDAFLAEGSIPIALIRAKLLGEPVPEL